MKPLFPCIQKFTKHCFICEEAIARWDDRIDQCIFEITPVSLHAVMHHPILKAELRQIVLPHNDFLPPETNRPLMRRLLFLQLCYSFQLYIIGHVLTDQCFKKFFLLQVIILACETDLSYY